MFRVLTRLFLTGCFMFSMGAIAAQELMRLGPRDQNLMSREEQMARMAIAVEEKVEDLQKKKLVPLAIPISAELGETLKNSPTPPTIEDLKSTTAAGLLRILKDAVGSLSTAELVPLLFVSQMVQPVGADRLGVNAKTGIVDWALVVFVAIESFELDLLRQTTNAMIQGGNSINKKDLFDYARKTGLAFITTGLVVGTVIGSSLAKAGMGRSDETIEAIEGIIRGTIAVSLSWCASEFLGSLLLGNTKRDLVTTRHINMIQAPGLIFHSAELLYLFAFLLTAESEEYPEILSSAAIGLAIWAVIHYGVKHFTGPIFQKIGKGSVLVMQLALVIYMFYGASHDWEEGEVGGNKIFDGVLAGAVAGVGGSRLAWDYYRHRTTGSGNTNGRDLELGNGNK